MLIIIIIPGVAYEKVKLLDNLKKNRGVLGQSIHYYYFFIIIFFSKYS